MKSERVVIEYKCERCRHEWTPQYPKKIPKVCPWCKSENWQTKQEKPIGRKRKRFSPRGRKEDVPVAKSRYIKGG